MKAQVILNKMEKLSYCDSRVLNAACDHFADELILTYEDADGDVSYRFRGCYLVNIEHVASSEKPQPFKDMTSKQCLGLVRKDRDWSWPMSS